MNFAAVWWSLIAPTSVQLLPLGIAIAVLDRILLRRVRSEWRAAVWALLFVKLLLPPSLSGSWAPVGLLPESVAAAYSGSEFASAHDQSWIPLAFTIWLIPLVSVLAFGAWRNLHSAPRSTETRAVSAEIRATAERIALALGLRKLPQITLTSRFEGPCVVGVLRPRVVLPERMAALEGSGELEHILAHELCHVRRRDPLRGTILFVLHAAFWFHPVVWLAHRKLNLLREQSCDLEAARVTGSAKNYRSTLLTLTAQMQGLEPRTGLGFLSSSRILSRLENLERGGARSRAPAGMHCAILTLILSACCLPMTEAPLPAAWDSETSLEDLPGCLPARFLVMRELAKQ